VTDEKMAKPDELMIRLERFIVGSKVARCLRHSDHELVLFFDDGTRLFVDAKGPLEFSITNSPKNI